MPSVPKPSKASKSREDKTMQKRARTAKPVKVRASKKDKAVASANGISPLHSLPGVPLRGKMGLVMKSLQDHGGMTKEEIQVEAKDRGLQGGSLDRMVFFARQVNLLK